jgi:hypothetical protein
MDRLVAPSFLPVLHANYRTKLLETRWQKEENLNPSVSFDFPIFSGSLAIWRRRSTLGSPHSNTKIGSVLVTSRKVQYTLFLKKDVFWGGELNRK